MSRKTLAQQQLKAWNEEYETRELHRYIELKALLQKLEAALPPVMPKWETGACKGKPMSVSILAMEARQAIEEFYERISLEDAQNVEAKLRIMKILESL